MNYRHAFHAGNFADVMKHALLARVLVYLATKPAPYRVIDTHAGTGLYSLASEAANRTGEWRDGIGRIRDVPMPAPVAALLQPYLDVVVPLVAAERPAYPGSPRLAMALSRTQDRLIFVEKHPEDIRALSKSVAGDRRARPLELDGWTALKAQVPPPERRGVVLVDPPFEEPGEFARMAEAAIAAQKKWPTGIFLLWYPIKDQGAVEDFAEMLQDSGIRKILRMELQVARPDAEGPLAGSGLIAINPPWPLKQEAETLLPWLAARLARGGWSAWRADWITPE